MLGKLLVLLLLSVTWAAADYQLPVGVTRIEPWNATGGVEENSVRVTINDTFAYFSFYPVDATALKEEGVVYHVWQTDSAGANATLVNCTAGKGEGKDCPADLQTPVISYTNTIYVTLMAPKNDNFTVNFNVSTVSTRGLGADAVVDKSNAHYLTISPKQLFENMEWTHSEVVGDLGGIIPFAASTVSIDDSNCYLAASKSVLSVAIQTGNETATPVKDGNFTTCDKAQAASTYTDKGKYSVVFTYSRTGVPLGDNQGKSFQARMLRTGDNGASTVAVSLLAVVAAVFMKFM